MLIDKTQFELVEKTLREQGKLAAFEKENGTVLGRMMITTDTIPEYILQDIEVRNDLKAFTASFDFYEMTVSAAVYTRSWEFTGALWLSPQTADAERPVHEWITFFLEKLFESIDEDGNYGVPICSFVTDTSDMTVVPAIKNLRRLYEKGNIEGASCFEQE